MRSFAPSPLQWRYNERDGLSNHQPHDCFYSTVYSRRRSKKTSKLCVTGLCEGNSPVTGEFPTQRTSNAENVSIWWRHHPACFWLFQGQRWFTVQVRSECHRSCGYAAGMKIASRPGPVSSSMTDQVPSQWDKAWNLLYLAMTLFKQKVALEHNGWQRVGSIFRYT